MKTIICSGIGLVCGAVLGTGVYLSQYQDGLAKGGFREVIKLVTSVTVCSSAGALGGATFVGRTSEKRNPLAEMNQAVLAWTNTQLANELLDSESIIRIKLELGHYGGHQSDRL